MRGENTSLVKSLMRDYSYFIVNKMSVMGHSFEVSVKVMLFAKVLGFVKDPKNSNAPLIFCGN